MFKICGNPFNCRQQHCLRNGNILMYLDKRELQRKIYEYKYLNRRHTLL